MAHACVGTSTSTRTARRVIVAAESYAGEERKRQLPPRFGQVAISDRDLDFQGYGKLKWSMRTSAVSKDLKIDLIYLCELIARMEWELVYNYNEEELGRVWT